MKRLLCFFDGTWNRPDRQDEQTNVVKLFNAVPTTAGDGLRQLSHYEIGIATTEGYGRWTFAAGAVGLDVPARIISGYRFLVETYEPGDEIYLFGFSRGAFEARMVGGLIALIGLLHKPEIERADDALAYYLIHREVPNAEVLNGLRQHAHQPRVRLIGVWDTVGNLGVPLAPRRIDRRELTFHNTWLSPKVDVGLHALSIDEPRGPFSPTFWTRPRGEALPQGQTIEQVWFPGCHANVGGGYKDSALSDLSLLWMAERAMALTGVDFDQQALRAVTRPDPLGEAVAPTADTVFRISAVLPFVRLLNQNVRGVSPLRRGLLGMWRTSLVEDNEAIVNEAIHASAFERYGKKVRWRCGEAVKAAVYRPRPLRLEAKRRQRQPQPQVG